MIEALDLPSDEIVTIDKTICSARSEENSDDGDPTLEIAKAMPISYREMDNTSLTTLGAMGKHKAREEILKRHIMAVDDVSYRQACEIFARIDAMNHESMYLLGLPFQTGVAVSFIAGFASIPLVFHLPTVEYFNSHFVLSSPPPPQELQTPLEVSIWSWDWMEPTLGTCTFVLLCMEYIR